MAPQQGWPHAEMARHGRRARDAPMFDLRVQMFGVDPTRIDVTTALAAVSQIGVDMSPGRPGSALAAVGMKMAATEQPA